MLIILMPNPSTTPHKEQDRAAPLRMEGGFDLTKHPHPYKIQAVVHFTPPRGGAFSAQACVPVADQNHFIG